MHFEGKSFRYEASVEIGCAITTKGSESANCSPVSFIGSFAWTKVLNSLTQHLKATVMLT